MNRAIVLILLLIATAGSTLAQKAKDYQYIGINNFPVNTETGRVVYEGVVDAEGRTAQELYDAALVWLTQNYTGKDAIKAQEPGQSISGRGAVQSTPTTVTKFDYLLQFKDGRYRYMLSNLVVLWSSGSTPLETFYPATIKNKNAARIQDQNMQQMHAAYSAETARLASIGTKKEDW